MNYDEALKYLTPAIREDMRAAGPRGQDKVLLKHYPTLKVSELVCLLTWHDIWETEDTEFLKCVDALIPKEKK